MRKKRKNSSSNFLQLIPLVLLLLSLCLNIYLLLGSRFTTALWKEPSLQELQELKKPGVYGPEGLEIVEGSLYICVPDVKLRNVCINGDLFLTAGIGDGAAELYGVTVRDTVLVEGGGEETVVFEDAAINHLVINREGARVRVQLKGDTVVEKLTIKGGAALSTAGLSEKGLVKELHIETAAQAELEGSCNRVKIAAKKARFNLTKGRVKKLVTASGADEALISLGKGAVIDLLEGGAPLALAGEGRVKKVVVAAPGLFQFSGAVGKVTAAGRGIFLEFGAGTTDTVLIKASEGTVAIDLAKEALIKYIRLDGVAAITGKGVIERLKINRSGSTVEQKPGSVELAVGVQAQIAGETVVKEEEKPEPPPQAAAKAPAPKAQAGPVQWCRIGDLTPGKKVMVVKLNYADPQNYSVTVAGVRLGYFSGEKVFRGEVPEKDAKAGNIRVSRK